MKKINYNDDDNESEIKTFKDKDEYIKLKQGIDKKNVINLEIKESNNKETKNNYNFKNIIQRINNKKISQKSVELLYNKRENFEMHRYIVI